jgi:hypothetical protein
VAAHEINATSQLFSREFSLNEQCNCTVPFAFLVKPQYAGDFLNRVLPGEGVLMQQTGAFSRSQSELFPHCNLKNLYDYCHYDLKVLELSEVSKS